ncbi:MAG: imidazolonepropionase [Sorangiineae bacterium]|nr:imidazolonepropionase [Polyangiaceae bacterium]MEB2323825.1 imidazolonepropionase [Sorangiineae bacterium]
MTAADLLLTGAAEVVTCAGSGPARGPAQGALGVLSRGAIAIGGGKILGVGDEHALRAEFHAESTRVLDAEGGVVLPGFVDPHTHLVFAGDRAAEWEARLAGTSYLELLARGGGIMSTVRATRAASFDALLANARRWASRMLALGTTTVEAKSGYGLDRATELRLLEVARAVGDELPIEIVSTFLGAHVVPAEYRERRGDYLAELEALHQELGARGLARFVDVFCEEEAFTLAETERLLRHARGLGLGLKLHAEQFTASGAAELGAALGAVSIDHLEHLSAGALERLAALSAPPVAVLLPGVSFHLAMNAHPNARGLIDAGVPVALATDFNPGSSFTPSMPMILALATRNLGMSVAEAIVAATRNAAHAVGLGDVVGSLEPGKRADLIICDVPEHRFLAYGFGWNPVRTVLARGERVVG